MVRFLLGGDNPILPLVYDDFLESGVTSMEKRLNFDAWPNEFTVGPVNVRVKCTEPWITKDKAVSSEVGDIELFHDFLISSGYEEVEVVCNASSFVVGAVNVL